MMASERLASRTEVTSHPGARASRRVGITLTTLAAMFLTFDTVLKVLRLGPAVDGTVALGYPLDSVRTIGIIELVCVVLYLVPRTAVLGALLLTGYLGGAIATHLRLGNPLFTHILFPVYVALFAWGGLYLRDPRIREFLPLRK